MVYFFLLQTQDIVDLIKLKKIMNWTTEREEKLKQLWKQGHSGSQIARLLGNGATSNSVLGKAFRLKLETRAV